MVKEREEEGKHRQGVPQYTSCTGKENKRINMVVVCLREQDSEGKRNNRGTKSWCA